MIVGQDVVFEGDHFLDLNHVEISEHLPEPARFKGDLRALGCQIMF